MQNGRHDTIATVSQGFERINHDGGLAVHNTIPCHTVAEGYNLLRVQFQFNTLLLCHNQCMRTVATVHRFVELGVRARLMNRLAAPNEGLTENNLTALYLMEGRIDIHYIHADTILSRIGHTYSVE